MQIAASRLHAAVFQYHHLFLESEPIMRTKQAGARSAAIPAPAARRRSYGWLIALALGLGALAPRLLGLADFYTIDEAYHWPLRVRLFSRALAEGNWAGTNLTGHPGVTTMWLGTLGRLIARWMGVGEPTYGDGATYLAFLRMPLVVVNSLAVVLGYLVLRRVLRPNTALLAGALWALSPFMIAHSRLLHVDALVTSFMTLSVLLMVWAAHDTPSASVARRSTWALAASGVCGGLALLTKGPALVLLPVVGLLLLGLSPSGTFVQRLRWTTPRYLIWLACAAVMFVLGWPAMWVTPTQAIGSMITEVIINGGQPHESGNYFMGQRVADPGWLFYPATILWRSTPVTLLGLLLLPLALWNTADQRRPLLALSSFALLFTIAISLGAKKFDRYLLPIWPTLEILGAAGLMALLDLRSVPAHLRRAVTVSVFLLASVPTMALDAWYHPYYLAYFNPLLGGGAAAQQNMLVGWGEGMEEIGAWLSRRPDIGNGPILSWIPPTLVYFVPQQVNDLTEPNIKQLSSYAVLYARSVQRQESAVAEAYARQTPPLYTLQRYGITYATIHQLPRPFTTPVDAVFDGTLHLRGFSQELAGNILTLTPSWNIQADHPGGVFCFVHVIGPDGTTIAQVDLPLDDGMFPTWQAGQQFGRPLTLTLPAGLPAGAYRVVLGSYNVTTGTRLPLTQGTAVPAEIDGPSVIELTTINLP